MCRKPGSLMYFFLGEALEAEEDYEEDDSEEEDEEEEEEDDENYKPPTGKENLRAGLAAVAGNPDCKQQ